MKPRAADEDNKRPVMIGKTLAHYEITSELGKGGMGEVWRARDTKLGRDVAIKTIPQAFADNEERLGRFEREAKLLASLNHPGIGAIYGLDESDGIRFLVLELIEGETLAERLVRGPIPVAESVALASQIVEAIEAAHEKGVIHRDLKPANIKITPDGKVKVLDFGLAKAFADDEASAELSNSPTLSRQATMQGVILGTAAYMSPEQAKGIPVDRRSDVFSFGCVLYEMLSGRRAFQGELATEILASVITREPDPSLLPSTLHPHLRELLRRCFEKDPRSRWQAVGDIRLELSRIADQPESTTSVSSATSFRQVLPWVVGAAALASAVTWSLKTPPTDPPPVVARFTYDFPELNGPRCRTLGDRGVARWAVPRVRRRYSALPSSDERGRSEADSGHGGECSAPGVLAGRRVGALPCGQRRSIEESPDRRRHRARHL